MVETQTKAVVQGWTHRSQRFQTEYLADSAGLISKTPPNEMQQPFVSIVEYSWCIICSSQYLVIHIVFRDP